MTLLSTRKPLRLAVGLLLGVLAASSLSMAANHYVRQGATGNGSGSDWANAYTDLPSSLVCGDTYYFAAGTYIPNGHIFNDGCSTVTTIKTATVADHGTSTGWSDSYAGQVVLHNLTFITGYYTFDGQYRTGWEGTYGMKVVFDPSISGYSAWLNGGTTVNNMTFRYIDFPGLGQNTTTTTHFVFWARYGFCVPGYTCSSGSYSNITFSYDYLHDIGQGGPIDYNHMTNLTVEYCEIARTTSTSGVHGESLNDTGSSNGVVARYNRFIDSNGTGVIIAHEASSGIYETMQNYSIYGNIFWQQHSGNYVGNGVIACINGQICSHWKIYNNTIVNFGGTQSHDGLSWDQSDPSSTDVIAENNLWYNDADVSVLQSTSGQITSDYNYYMNCTNAPSETHIQTGTSDIFKDSANGDFHLATETNDGLHLSSPYDVDPDGVTRGSDNNIWSRGAYQYNPNSSSSVAPPSNLTVAGVH